MIRLSEALYTKSPIDLQRKRIMEDGSIALGRSIVKNYGKDAFSTALLESIMDSDPVLMNEFKSYGGFGILSEAEGEPELKSSMSGGLAQRKESGGSGGFFKKLGDAAKGAMASIELGTRALADAVGFNKGDKQLRADYEKMLAKYGAGMAHNIATIDERIRSAIPDFPNNGVTATKNVDFKKLGYQGDTKDITPHGVFIAGLGLIAGMYDSVVESHDKPDGITTDQANIVIDDLRAMCVKYSNELAGMYTKFESSQKLKMMPLLYEAEVSSSKGDSLRSASAEGAETAETAENKKKLLPKIFQGLGIGVAALGVLQMMPFFQDWVNGTFREDTYKTITTETSVPGPTIPSGDGTLPAFSYQLQDALKGKGLNLSTDDMVKMTKDQTVQHCKDLGWIDASGNLTQGIIDLHKASGLPGDMADAWSKTIGAVPGNTPMGGAGGFWSISKNPLFGNKPTPRALHQALGFIHGPIATTMKKAVMETVKVAGGGALTPLGTILLSSALGPQMIAAGVAIYALGKGWEMLKDKGLKTSRSAALQELKDFMKDLKPRQTEINPVPPPEPNPVPPPVVVPPESKGPDKVTVYLTGEKTMIGWDDPHDLLAPLTEGTIECDDKDNIKVDTNDAAVVARARQILVKYFVCKPQRIKPSEKSGLKTNDFSTFPKKLMELDVVVVKIGEDGKAETEVIPGETPPDVPDTVADDFKKKKKSVTEPGTGRIVRVDLSNKPAKKAAGETVITAPPAAPTPAPPSAPKPSGTPSPILGPDGKPAMREQRSMRPSIFNAMFEHGEARYDAKMKGPEYADTRKSLDNLQKKLSAAKTPVPGDTKAFPRIEKNFYDGNKINKGGMQLFPVDTSTVAKGFKTLKGKVRSGNVNLGFDTSTSNDLLALGLKPEDLTKILKLYAAKDTRAPTFDEYKKALGQKRTLKWEEIENQFNQIGLIGKAKKAATAPSEPAPTKEWIDQDSDEVILERWQTLAGLIRG